MNLRGKNINTHCCVLHAPHAPARGRWELEISGTFSWPFSTGWGSWVWKNKMLIPCSLLRVRLGKATDAGTQYRESGFGEIKALEISSGCAYAKVFPVLNVVIGIDVPACR